MEATIVISFGIGVATYILKDILDKAYTKTDNFYFYALLFLDKILCVLSFGVSLSIIVVLFINQLFRLF